MVITNGLVFTDCMFAWLDVQIEGERIVRLAPAGSLRDDVVLDAERGYVLPGFVDIHTHGAMGSDTCDADAEGMKKMLDFYGKNGVTSVVPATMAFNEPILSGILKPLLPLMEKDGHGAVLRGVNLEGPFISRDKAGAQNPTYITDPDLAAFDALYALAGRYIKMVDIAPELPGSEEFIRHVAGRCVVSLAHTAATYDQAAAAFRAGAMHVTHLYNAMLPFGHREPGLIGAASDYAGHVEVISDGIHLHPAVVRATFEWFGENRVCLISDSMRGTGLPDGEYDLGGQMVHMEKGKATLAGTNTIAGSATNLAECCRRAIGFGVPMEQAVRAASLNPAQAVGLDHEVGSLAAGMRADVVVWNPELAQQAVLVGGQVVAQS